MFVSLLYNLNICFSFAYLKVMKRLFSFVFLSHHKESATVDDIPIKLKSYKLELLGKLVV